MEIKCSYSSHVNEDHYSGNAYICSVDEIKGGHPRNGIGSLDGEHEEGKTNEDVEWLDFQYKRVRIVPNKLTEMFRNLRYLTLWDCGISQLKKEDLRGLENIEYLDFSDNFLTILPDDLFTDMKKLSCIYFTDNHIERMSSNLLQPIKAFLDVADFSWNTKINDKFDLKSEDKNDLAKFMEAIDEKCLPLGWKADMLLSEFSKFKTTGEFSDFTVKVREQEFKIHKMVFAAQSSVFKKIFTDDTEEVTSCFEKVKNFSDETFQGFLDYFYTGKVNISVNAMEMFELASVFDVPQLKQICSARILADLGTMNAVDVFNVGHRHKSEELKQKSFVIIKEMFPGLKDNFANKLEKVNRLAALKAQMDAIMEEE